MSSADLARGAWLHMWRNCQGSYCERHWTMHRAAKHTRIFSHRRRYLSRCLSFGGWRRADWLREGSPKWHQALPATNLRRTFLQHPRWQRNALLCVQSNVLSHRDMMHSVYNINIPLFLLLSMFYCTGRTDLMLSRVASLVKLGARVLDLSQLRRTHCLHRRCRRCRRRRCRSARLERRERHRIAAV